VIDTNSEPEISVGLITGVESAKVTLSGIFSSAGLQGLTGNLSFVASQNGGISVQGASEFQAPEVILAPSDFERCRITLHDVTIGVGFHWERKEEQIFQGSLRIIAGEKGLNIINLVPLEAYLVSVISSEMSAANHSELLKAHAIVSRSWLLAQLIGGDKRSGTEEQYSKAYDNTLEINRWYSRENHSDFDVCADDHCQRYQGISKAFSASASEAVVPTRGIVAEYLDQICDARYSKCCGGLTERYSAAWENKPAPYLTSIYDGADSPGGYELPLRDEKESARWITSLPRAYCNDPPPYLLERILPGFDLETRDSYRWVVSYSSDELREIIFSKLGEDPGIILAIEPLERGASGRLIRVKISGQKRTLIVGKELEIRRALSRSHLYSSAFVVSHEESQHTGYPERFIFKGAGWGHGVGLCQIGAAVMADAGQSHERIVEHYFRGAKLKRLYD